jgi:hypothetical protein
MCRIDAVLICRARDGGWLVLSGAHGWLCGSRADARREAHWLALNLNLVVREISP